MIIAKDKIDLKPAWAMTAMFITSTRTRAAVPAAISSKPEPCLLTPPRMRRATPTASRVELKLKNPNYRFCTVGTNWQPSDTIILYVTCYEEGMNEVDLYLEGDDKPLETFEGDGCTSTPARASFLPPVT